MEKMNPEINEESLERIAGGAASESAFRINVDYSMYSQKDPGNRKMRQFQSYVVSPDETVGHIEQRTIEHCWCQGGTAQTYYNGAPVRKEMTMAQLGIKEYEILKMDLTLWGYSW